MLLLKETRFDSRVAVFDHTIHCVTLNDAQCKIVSIKRSVKILLRNVKRCPIITSRSSLWLHPMLFRFRNFCDATGPRLSYAVRFAVQIIYLSCRRIASRIHKEIPRRTVSKEIGNLSWNQIRTISLTTKNQGGKVVLKAQRKTIWKCCWIPVVNSLL